MAIAALLRLERQPGAKSLARRTKLADQCVQRLNRGLGSAPTRYPSTHDAR